MKIVEIRENKKEYLELLLLADEQESMIDRYLDRGSMYALFEDGVRAVGVVTDEGGGILELKNLAVRPEYQRKGIGTALVKEGHRIGKELGYSYSVVLGSENYYPRFGYVPANQFGIRPPFDVAEENFMAVKLNAAAPLLNGTLRYAREFGID